MLRNTATHFGRVTRWVHWVMAFGLIGAFAFGRYLAGLTVDGSNFHLFGWHKSLGLSLLVLAALRIVWTRHSPPPAPISAGTPVWQLTLAVWTHRALYLLMLAVPLSGWTASAATGIPVRPFGLFTLPRVVPVSEDLASAGFVLHGALASSLAAIVGLHIAGALFRHIVKRDQTLIRMLRGG